MIHDKTKEKVKKLFSMGDSFCEKQLEKYSNYPDVMFIIDAFSTAFNEFDYKLRRSKIYDVGKYHEDVFELDSILSSWKSNLIYKLPYDNDNANDLYTVLFSILQGVEELLDDDHFYWEEDEDNLENAKEDYSDEMDFEPDYRLSTDEDENYIERTF